MKEHKSYSNRRNELIYCIIRGNGGWNNWTYEVLDVIDDCTRNDAYIREQCWIEQLRPTLNCCSARRPAYTTGCTPIASALKRFLLHRDQGLL